MKYYSEILKKFFDTYDECVVEEKNYLKEQKKIEEDKSNLSVTKKEDTKSSEKQNEKKQLAKEIEAADKIVNEAYLEYTDACTKAQELRKETEKKCSEIIKEARKHLQDAENEKFLAVQKFNDKFGPYVVSYTGEEALKQKNRIGRILSNMFSPFDSFFIW